MNGQEVALLLEVKPSPIIGKVMAFLKDKEEELAVLKKGLTKILATQLLSKKYT